MVEKLEFLRDLLRHEKVRDKIRESLDQQRTAAADGNRLWRLEEDRTIVDDAIRRHLSDVLRFVFGNATPLSLEDVVDAIFHQVGGRETRSDEWLQAYDRAIDFALNKVVPDGFYRARQRAGWLHQNRHDILGSLGVFTKRKRFEFDWPKVWEDEHGYFWIELGEGQADGHFDLTDEKARLQVDVHLNGIASPSAISGLQSQLAPWTTVLGNIFRSSAILGEREDYRDEGFFQALYGHAEVRILFLKSSAAKSFFASCFDALTKTRLTTLQQRLLNALVLMQQAINAPLPAMAFTQRMAAIEAILTDSARDKNGKTRAIGERSGALLTHDSERRAKASDVISTKEIGLYATRSRIAHGEDLAMSEERIRAAHFLAAGVIRGICTWSQHNRSLEHDEFLLALQESAKTGTPLDGVPELGELLPS
jgi:hypothetical protein